MVWVSSEQGPQAVASSYEASKYHVDAQNRIKANCAGLEGVRFSECFIDIDQSERENHNTQKDVRAQRYMAVWAFVMAYAAVVTMGVTAVGLGWIKATLDETRRAVDSADSAVDVTREIGEAQVRAYLSLDEISVEFIRVDNPDGSNFAVEINHKTINSGNSPAISYNILYDITVVKQGEIVAIHNDGSGLQDAGLTTNIITAGGFNRGTLSRTMTVNRKRVMSNEDRVRFTYMICYTDVFKKEQRMPIVSGSIYIRKEDGGLMFISDVVQASDTQYA